VSDRVCELQASTQSFTQSTSHDGGHDLRPQHWKEHACRWSGAAQTLSWAVPAEADANMHVPAIRTIRSNFEPIIGTLHRSHATHTDRP
jgi:branched-subunit amino acid aminotransferase/4-amino-4-deoxychorismate lyase